jgi:hypothetical protein
MFKAISQTQYQQRVTELQDLCERIVAAKRKVYTLGQQDTHRNFRVTAAIKGSTAGDEIATHLLKQVGAVVNLLCHPEIDDSEQDTRFADLRNYVDLAYVLYKEGQAHDKI